MLALASCGAAFVPQPAPAPPSWPPCPAEFAGTTRLWRAVVARVLLDAFGLDLGNESRAQPQLAIDRATRAWLDKPSPDRDAMLDLAGLAPGDLDRHLPRLCDLWAMADAGRLPPEATGKRGTPCSCLSRATRRQREN